MGKVSFSGHAEFNIETFYKTLNNKYFQFFFINLRIELIGFFN